MALGRVRKNSVGILPKYVKSSVIGRRSCDKRSRERKSRVEEADKKRRASEEKRKQIRKKELRQGVATEEEFATEQKPRQKENIGQDELRWKQPCKKA